MAENKNEVLDIGMTAFSLLSFKVKIIIICVIIGIFIVVIFPVVAIMSLTSNDNNTEKKGESTSSDTTITVNEVISSDNLKKYIGAVFPMPFETWDSGKDVVTSKFSKSRTITVNGRTQTKAHTRNRFSSYIN